MKIVVFILIALFSSVILKAQEQTKDTLFLKLDGKYIYESKYDLKQYIIKDNNDIKNGAIYFKEFKRLARGPKRQFRSPAFANINLPFWPLRYPIH